MTIHLVRWLLFLRALAMNLRAHSGTGGDNPQASTDRGEDTDGGGGGQEDDEDEDDGDARSPSPVPVARGALDATKAKVARYTSPV